MGWVRFDDGFLDHPKFLVAGPLAGYLNLCAIAWCSRNRTDGRIPRAQVARLVNFTGIGVHTWTAAGGLAGGGRDVDVSDLVDELVTVGLWELAEDGFQVHDYLEWQRSRDEIEAASERARQAGRKGGQARSTSKSSSKSLSESPNGLPSTLPSKSASKTQAEDR